MFHSIKGSVTKLCPEWVAVEANGVGYKIFTTPGTIGKLSAQKQQVTLYISFVVREFAHTLYGFLEESERDLFEALLNITGIGPKTALSIIATLTVQDLQEALYKKDLQLLCKVPGIGKKTAERLLVELKDTLPLLATLDREKPTVSLKAQATIDAVSALMNLGYNQFTAQKAVQKVLDQSKAELELSELITLSLKSV
jgi:holliday junction DNA helicase RuvA